MPDKLTGLNSGFSPTEDARQESTQRLAETRWVDWACVALLAALAMLFLWRVVFLGQILAPLDLLFTIEPWRSELPGMLNGPIWNPVPSDVVYQYVPMAIYVKEALGRGEIAFWDPYVLSGMPVLAMGSWMVLYPIANVLWLFLPAAQTLSGLAVIHLFLGELFMFLLLREMKTGHFGALVGALAFAFNGYMVVWLANVAHPASMVWLPLVLWGVERALRRQDWRWALVGTLAFAVQILGGNPLRAFHGATAVGLFALYRAGLIWWEEREIWQAARPLLYSGLALVGGLALAAPQMMPTLELYSLSIRTEAMTFRGLPIETIIRLLVPDFYGNPLDANYSLQINFAETNLYFGILPLICVITSLFSPQRRLAWGLAGIGTLALLLAYGVPPFYQVFYHLYPAFQATFVGRFFYITTFAWAVAAGLGADWLVSGRPANFLRCLNLVVIGLGVVILLWSLWLILPEKYQARVFWRFAQDVTVPATTPETSTLYRGTSLLTSFTFLAAAALLLHSWGSGRIGQPLFVALGTVLVMGDLFLAGINYLPAFDPALLYPETPSLQFLQALDEKDPQPHRVLPLRYAWPSFLLTEDVGGVYHLSGVHGRSSWMSDRYARYINLTGWRYVIHSTPVRIAFYGYDSRLLDALNTKYIYVPPYIPWQYDLAPTIHDEQPIVPGAIAMTTWTIDNVSKKVFYESPPSSFSLFGGHLPQQPLYLKTAIAMQPDSWDKGGDGVQFEIYLQWADEQPRELLFSQYIDPKHNPAEQHWIPVEIDLSKYIGKPTLDFTQSADTKVSFTFVTKPGPANDNYYDWAGWAEPVLETPPVDTSKLELLFDGPNKVYYNKQALPRVWVVHWVTQVPEKDIEAVEARLIADDFEPAIEAVVEGELPGALGEASPSDRVEVTSYAAHRVKIEVNLAQPGLLVLSDMFYPGWKAYVDGVERPIYATNLIMRGVYLKEGKHRVIFVYKPVAFTRGLYISGGTSLLILLGLAWQWRQSCRRETLVEPQTEE